MNTFQKVLGGTGLALVLTASLATPAMAQTPVDTVAADIDFGNNSSRWANDGECDDPRFQGPGSASELVQADSFRDASDCRAAFAAGTITLNEVESPAAATEPSYAPDVAASDPANSSAAAEIDFGDDSGNWSNDGECDDPRFEGYAIASVLEENDRLRDATDCRVAYEAGYIVLKGSGQTPANRPPEPEVEIASIPRGSAAVSVAPLAPDILAGIDIPPGANAEAGSLFGGGAFRFSDSTYVLAGSIAYQLLESCALDLSVADRLDLATFAYTASQHGMSGNEYSNPDIGAMMRDQMASMSMLTIGLQMGKQIGCREPVASEVAQYILSLVQSNRGDGQPEQTASFIGSCEQALSAAQCTCLARMGQAAYPNIYQMRYSRELVYSILTRNPIMGMQIALVCQIGNY